MMPSAEGSNRAKVAIIGAGLTGLITAHGLKQNGIDVVVFDAEPSIDERSSRDRTIYIHWSMPTLRSLVPASIMDKFLEAVCNPYLDFTKEEAESIAFYNGLTEDLMFTEPAPGGRRISRQRLRKVFAEGLDIEWGMKIEELSPSTNSVRMMFEGGKIRDASFVLGTDGASSKVRQLLFTPELARPTGSGVVMGMCIAKYGDADKVSRITKAHPVTAFSLGPNAIAACGTSHVDNPQDMSTWTVFWFKAWRGEPVTLQGKAAVDFMKRNTDNIYEVHKSAISWTPEDSSCYVGEGRYWVPIPWNNFGGRVTLAGDAAHPVLPFRGQGLNHGIIDAQNYVEAMVKLTKTSDAAAVAEVMTAYDAEVVERGAKAVKQSVQEAEDSFDSTSFSKTLLASRGIRRCA